MGGGGSGTCLHARREAPGFMLPPPPRGALHKTPRRPSELPSRLLLWGLAAGISHTVDPLTDISYGWLALNRWAAPVEGGGGGR